MAMAKVVLLVALLVAVGATVASAQDCDENRSCGDGRCCSQWGYCGCTFDYCGSGCKSQCNSCGGAAATIGVCYGRLGNNLPSPSQVVALLQGRGVTNVKIYDAAHDVLTAFANSGIDLSVAVPNQEVAVIANDQAAANGWVQDNIRAFVAATKIGSIAVGNEYLTDSSNDPSKLLPAMQNIQRALESLGLGSIKVSTPHEFGVIGVSFPPSAGAFNDNYVNVMRGILEFLRQKNSVFMVNIYPFFAYRFNSGQINLDYALFNPNAPSVSDSGRTYRNLFDAQVDSVIAAMNRLGYGDLPLMITESGWPSGGGGVGANVQNARTYNNNLVKHVLQNGTPMRPGDRIPTYIFALFNENQKGGDAIETNFGLFYPNQSPVYDISLSAAATSLPRNVSLVDIQEVASLALE
jgi:exo-beta-1,3-glucanase (GH17 family)